MIPTPTAVRLVPAAWVPPMRSEYAQRYWAAMSTVSFDLVPYTPELARWIFEHRNDHNRNVRPSQWRGLRAA